MQKYYLLGSPVAHSLSPAMHNCAFRALHIDAEYAVLDVTEDDLPAVIDRLRSEGAAGWNVTMPVKTAMHGLCEVLSADHEVLRRRGTFRNWRASDTGFHHTQRAYEYALRCHQIFRGNPSWHRRGGHVHPDRGGPRKCRRHQGFLPQQVFPRRDARHPAPSCKEHEDENRIRSTFGRRGPAEGRGYLSRPDQRDKCRDGRNRPRRQLAAASVDRPSEAAFGL